MKKIITKQFNRTVFQIIAFTIWPLQALSNTCSELLWLANYSQIEFKTGQKVEALQIKTFQTSIPLKKIFTNSGQLTLIGATNYGHFYLIHDSNKVDATPLKRIRVKNTVAVPAGVFVSLKNLSAEQKQKLLNSISENRGQYSISCSSCVMSVLKDAGITVSSVTPLTRTFAENTFRRLLTEKMLDYEGNEIEFDIFETQNLIHQEVIQELAHNDWHYSSFTFVMALIGSVVTYVFVTVWF